MSLTTGLIHPGDKFLNVEPTRAWNVTQIGATTFRVNEAYSAGEVVWQSRTTTSTLYILKRNIAVNEEVDYSLNPASPLFPNNPFTIIGGINNIYTNLKNVNAINPITSPDWNRLSLSFTPSYPNNHAELIRRGVNNDFGAIVYNKPIPNNWRSLTIRATTSIIGDADILYFSLITDSTVINQTTQSLFGKDGLFSYVNIFGNSVGFSKWSGGSQIFNVSNGATSNKDGQMYSSYITFERETITSESIRTTGSLNGLFYSSSFQANALPITGESYITVGAQSGGSNAGMTAGGITYALTYA